MYYYSKRSRSKIVHQSTCQHIQNVSVEDVGSFENLEDAYAAGYRLCRHCSPIAKLYRKESDVLQGYCQSHAASVFFKDRFIGISTPISDWRIIPSGKGNEVVLYPAYQSEPDKILRYDIAGGDSFPETMISNTYAATEMTLRRFTSRGDATFHFFYDYGDGWEVVLRLEEVFEDSELPGKELPRVLEGQGFGIIEDCGGPAGLEHLREVFQQKSSPEYQSMREWLGTSEVDLSVFDLQDLNFRLKKLPRIFRDLYEYDYPPTKHSIDLLDRKYCKTN